MRDKSALMLGVIVLMAATLACNAFAGRADSLPPPPQPATAPAILTPANPSAPLAPTATLPGDATPAEAQGIVRILVDLNIRSGPDVSYDRVGFLLKDERAVVIGRDTRSGWWRIQCPPAAEGSECWVSGGSQFTLLESTE